MDVKSSVTSALDAFLDIIPVIGHVKGGIHYITGNKEGGHRAMLAACRTTAVMGLGTISKDGSSTLETFAAAAFAGTCYDLAVAYGTDGRRVNGIIKVFHKPKEPCSYVKAIVDTFADVALLRLAGVVTTVSLRMAAMSVAAKLGLTVGLSAPVGYVLLIAYHFSISLNYTN